nr:MAG TPA: hypothetical protein [Caudoviricetes sp.]
MAMRSAAWVLVLCMVRITSSRTPISLKHSKGVSFLMA